MRRARMPFLGALAMVLSLSLLAVSPAGASHDSSAERRVPNSCGTVNFPESPYGVLAKGVKCRFARHWTRRYQNTGKRPKHWGCYGRGSYTELAGCKDRRSRAYFQYYIED